MFRLTARSVRFFLLALLVCCSFCWVAAGFALADPPPEYIAPADKALEPEMAELAACPTAEVPVLAEEEAEGEEVEPVAPELRELGHMRLEQQEACKAQADRLDQVIERLWWVTAQTLALDRSDPGFAEANGWLEHLSQQDDARSVDLHMIREALTEIGPGTLRSVLLGSEDEKALPVLGEFEAGPMEADPELVSSIDAAGEATQAGIYMIGGLLLGCFIGYLFWRSVHNAT
jgi:hypothetical protein